MFKYDLDSFDSFSLYAMSMLFFAQIQGLAQEKVRKAKICPRSWQQIDDFMADSEKTKRLHEQKGVPYESMRDYLQEREHLFGHAKRLFIDHKNRVLSAVPFGFFEVWRIRAALPSRNTWNG